jgi:two-component system, OmpR family, response regulator
MPQTALKTVLYVDDEADIRHIAQIALELNGTIKVETAGSGEQALENARRQKPDLMLLDVMMPGIDGPTTLRRMRTDSALARIPVVFITAKALPHEVAGLGELGAVGVIAKPFDPMELENQVQAIWNGLGEGSAQAQKSDLPEAVEEEVKALYEAFLARTRTEAVTMRDLVERAVAGDRTALSQLEKMTHRIHGTGAVFGFSAISDSAEVIERMAERLLARDAAISTPLDPQAARELQSRYGQLVCEIQAAAVSAGQCA